jgi:hypothetical protein
MPTRWVTPRFRRAFSNRKVFSMIFPPAGIVSPCTVSTAESASAQVSLNAGW